MKTAETTIPVLGECRGKYGLNCKSRGTVEFNVASKNTHCREGHGLPQLLNRRSLTLMRRGIAKRLYRFEGVAGRELPQLTC